MDEVTIILAEDDDGHATLVERNLRRAGLDNGFVRLKDGQEALDYLLGPDTQHCESCILLLDIKMPRVDGIEVLRRLKGDPKTATLPLPLRAKTAAPPRRNAAGDRRSAGDRALLPARMQRLCHQAGRVRAVHRGGKAPG